MRKILLGDTERASQYLPEAEGLLKWIKVQQDRGLSITKKIKRITDDLWIIARHDESIFQSSVIIFAGFPDLRFDYDLIYRSITAEAGNIMAFFGFDFSKDKEQDIVNLDLDDFLDLGEAGVFYINLSRFFSKRGSLMVTQISGTGYPSNPGRLPTEVIFTQKSGKMATSGQPARPPIDNTIDGYDETLNWIRAIEDTSSQYWSLNAQDFVEGSAGEQYLICGRFGITAEILDGKSVILERNITIRGDQYTEFFRFPVTDDTQSFDQMLVKFPLQINPVWDSGEWKDLPNQFPPEHIISSDKYVSATQDGLIIRTIDGRSFSAQAGGNYYNYVEFWRFDKGFDAVRHLAWVDRDPFAPGLQRDILMNFMKDTNDEESGIMVKESVDAVGALGDKFTLFINSSVGGVDDLSEKLSGILGTIMGYGTRAANDTNGTSLFWVDGWRIGPDEYGFRYYNNDNASPGFYLNNYADAVLRWKDGTFSVIHSPDKSRSLSSYFEINQYRPWEIVILESDRPTGLNQRANVAIKRVNLRTGVETIIREDADFFDSVNLPRFMTKQGA